MTRYLTPDIMVTYRKSKQVMKLWQYLVSFARYSDLLVENRYIFIPHMYLAPPQGVIPSEFREHLDIHKTRMNGLQFGEESMTIYSAVLIGCQRVTDRQMDGRTSSLYLLRASAQLTHVKMFWDLFIGNDLLLCTRVQSFLFAARWRHYRSYQISNSGFSGATCRPCGAKNPEIGPRQSCR